MTTNSTIYIVDDDDAVRDSLRFLLETTGYNVLTFSSGEEFLEKYDPSLVSILITDVRMPGMSGLQLQEELNARKVNIPVVFITGHGTVPMVVNTMKKGAVDFIEKPFNLTEIQEVITNLSKEAQVRAAAAQSQRANEELLGRLTTREQQVLGRIVAGRLNKQIADDLNISIKTVEAHRANIMEKLQVSTVADLMKVALNSQSTKE
ncbi:response regulator transcription factor [Pelistega europaea]|uniref:Response regulator transcription factor n=1 Tax=Pelistega europaea TaxID=106147 RepID=A0A7Y4P430_9BURK|nr:response regulator transcription factor [Pelistega europaea]NOL49066.1 response regulator transcription factor [Pelistega europaea]